MSERHIVGLGGGGDTPEQTRRLHDYVFEIIGKTGRAKPCEAMQGITAEMEEDMEEFGDTPAGDAVLIGCGQAVEHYEMAAYGTVRAIAEKLGQKDVARLLQQTLDEEGMADKILTQIAESSVNTRASASA